MQPNSGLFLDPDAPALRRAPLQQLWREHLMRGVFGIPTLFVGDEMFFGKERLGQVEEAIKAAKDPAGGKSHYLVCT